jgi:hypothetical protein
VFFDRRSFTVYAEAFGEGVAKVIGAGGKNIKDKTTTKTTFG